MHDGELPPDQQSRLEKQIRESEQLGSELAEFKQLSALITAVPTQQAPGDLARKVMSQILIAPAATTTTAPPAAKSKRWPGVAAALTAAAALFLMFQFVGSGEPESANEMAMTPASKSRAVTAAVATDSAPATLTEQAGARESVAQMGPPPSARTMKSSPHAMTKQIAANDTSVIEIDSRETDVAVLLQTLFTAEMLEHRRSKDKALDAAGLQAIVVEVDATDVSSMLTKVEALAGTDSLSLTRDTDPASLRQKLLLAESLYEKGAINPAPKGRNAQLIAGNPRQPAAPKADVRARGGRKTQLVPKPPRIESQTADSELADLKRPKNAANNSGAGFPGGAGGSGFGGGGAEPASASIARRSAAPNKNDVADKRTRLMESVAGNDTPAAPESVKVIFVMKKAQPASDDNSNPCDDIDA